MEFLEKSFNNIFSGVMEKNTDNLSKAYQKIARICEVNASDAPNEAEDVFWSKKSKEMLTLARGLSNVMSVSDTQNTDVFKTNFKFASKEERTLYQRFVQFGRVSGNRYMYYTVTDKDYNYRTSDFKYFLDSNENVLERFEEITNYEYVITDKKFLLNNDFSNESSIGKRYVYYVDIDDFKESSKNNPLEHSVLSKQFRFAKVFKSYEALLEHLETNVKNKAIYIISENAFNGLRYVVDSIETVVCPTLSIKSEEPLISHDFQKYGDFLGMRKSSKDVFTRKEKVIEEVEKKENFSNFIRFAATSKTTKEVSKDIDYTLFKLTRAGLKPTVYRWAKRAKKNDFSRFIQVGNVVLELDDNLKLTGIESYHDGHIKDSVNYISTGKPLQNGLSLTQNDLSRFNRETIEELSKIIHIQIIG